MTTRTELIKGLRYCIENHLYDDTTMDLAADMLEADGKLQAAARLALDVLSMFSTPRWAGTGCDEANKANAALTEALK
jgi:hypothetical protein